MTDYPHKIAGSTRRRGFTLIEIMVVTIILGIVSALALPSLISQDDLAASAASRIVVSDLLYAQSQAIATQQTQYVSFSVASTQANGGWGNYSIYNNEPFTAAILNPQTLAGYIETFGSGGTGPLAGVALTSVAFDGSANTVLAFNELGQPLVCPANGPPAPLANTGGITLQCGAMTEVVSIEPSTGNLTVSP